MVICPQCNIEHDPLEEFCKKCGKFLLSVEDPVPEKEKAEVSLICPKCQVLHKKGKYCRKCGSLLINQTPSQRTDDVQPLQEKSVKRWVKEWLSLLEEEKKLESCISKLEAQGNNISTNVVNPLMVRYKDQLASLSPLHQEIETELESFRKRATEEIDHLENQMKPIQKRLEEFQSLYKSSAVTKADFLREKKELTKEVKSIKRSLRKFRHILSLLPGPVGGNAESPELAGGLLRPLTLTTGGIILLLIITGAYLLWQQRPQFNKRISIEVTPSPPPSPPDPQPVTENKEIEKIGSVFENIRRANLQKNIDLFMSCFSRDFKDAEEKRKDTLKMWKAFNYHDLSYDLKKQAISGDTADVRLEWVIRTSKGVGGKPHTGRTVLDVTLKREDGHWKIKEINPVS
jgi:hypothetical protein